MRKHIFLTVGVTTLSLFACHQPDDDAQLAVAQIAAFANAPSIEAKFDVYVEVYRSETPPNVTLASPLAELGGEAYLVALERAQHDGDLTDIMASLEVIHRYNARFYQKCSAEGEELILRNAMQHLRKVNHATFDEIVRHSCRLMNGVAADRPNTETAEQA